MIKAIFVKHKLSNEIELILHEEGKSLTAVTVNEGHSTCCIDYVKEECEVFKEGHEDKTRLLDLYSDMDLEFVDNLAQLIY